MEVKLSTWLLVLGLLLVFLATSLIDRWIRLKGLKQELDESVQAQNILVLLSSGDFYNALYYLKKFQGELRAHVKVEIERLFLNLVVNEIKERQKFLGDYKELPSFLIRVMYNEVHKKLKLEDLSKLIVRICVDEVRNNPGFFLNDWDSKSFRDMVQMFLQKMPELQDCRTRIEKRACLKKSFLKTSETFDIRNDVREIVKGRLTEFSYEVFPDKLVI